MTTDDMTVFEQQLSHYQTLMEQPKTAGFQKWTEAAQASDFFGNFTEECGANPDYIVDRFQSVITMDVQTYTIAELINSAVIQMQNSVLISNVGKIWTDKDSGLANLGLLLMNPEVFVNMDGTIQLIGGNHRLASFIWAMMEGDADLETIAQMNIKVTQYECDYDILTELLTITDEDGNTITPSKNQLKQVVTKIGYQLWLASNGSRTMKSGEITNSRLFEKGVDRSDLDSVMDSCFTKPGEAKLVTPAECFRLVSLIKLDELGQQDNHATEDHTPDTVKALLNIPCLDNPVLLRKKTAEDIFKSIFTQLSRVSNTVEIRNAKTGEMKTRKVNLYAKDLKLPGNFLNIIDSMFEEFQDGMTLLEYGIHSVLSNLPEESEFKGNIARNATAIAECIAALIQTVRPPMVETEKPKSKKTTVNVMKGLAL